MKPIELELQAFGPYPGVEKVDFAKLSENGIFLIKGPTGSGKTTIFDAMTYALYGGSTGDSSKQKNGRNSIEEWRCNQAPDCVPTYVKFTFEADGRTYCFKRSYEKRRTSFSQKYEGIMYEADGNPVTLFENCKDKDLNSKSEELIGLDKDQFRQVVLLPQGQFEKFLVADSNEKDRILTKIFNTEQWEGYANRFHEIASARYGKLLRLKEGMLTLLKDIDESFTTPDDLADYIAGLEAENERIREEYILFDESGKQKILEGLRAVLSSFKDLHDEEKRLAELISKQDTYDDYKRQLSEAEKADGIKELLKEAKEAETGKAIRRQKYDDLCSQTVTVREATSDAKDKAEEHRLKSPVTELTALKGRLESKKSSYEQLDILRANQQNAEKEVNVSRAARKAADEAYKAACDKHRELYEKFESLNDEAACLRKKHYAGIYGEIADRLTDGEKCPVCGSTSHPSPACKTEDSVSEEQVEKAETAAKKAEELHRKAEEQKKKAELALGNADKAYNEKLLNKQKADTELAANLNNLESGIESSADLERKIHDIDREILAYNQEGERLAQNLEECRMRLSRLEADIKTAEDEARLAAELSEAKTLDLNRELKAKGYESREEAENSIMSQDKQNRLREMISEYNTRITDLRESVRDKAEKLKDETEPDERESADLQKEINDTKKAYTAKTAVLAERINELSHKKENLQKDYDKFRSEWDEASDDLAFAKKLRGDTGVGLHRYVLGIMFEQVIGEANRMLEKVHGGRYQLFRTNERVNGNKRGLELKVHDSRSPEREGRGVSLLSGGEKFLVSLALSIGMSSVAQKSGVKIEALFIDEGFGTLDENSIADAMDVLQCVRNSNSMIGIISHVQILEANIPTHIEVLKTESGSSIKVC